MPRDSIDTTGGPYRKPTPDIYTVLLAVALVALLMAILILYLDMSVANFQLRGAPSAALAPLPLAPVALDAGSPAGSAIAFAPAAAGRAGPGADCPACRA